MRPPRPIVIIESPWQNGTGRNPEYARAALRDSLLRGEAPYASHLLYTQPGVLRDEDKEERKLGLTVGWEFMCKAALVAVYRDLGITQGMELGIAHALQHGLRIEYRSLPTWG